MQGGVSAAGWFGVDISYRDGVWKRGVICYFDVFLGVSPTAIRLITSSATIVKCIHNLQSHKPSFTAAPRSRRQGKWLKSREMVCAHVLSDSCLTTQSRRVFQVPTTSALTFNKTQAQPWRHSTVLGTMTLLHIFIRILCRPEDRQLSESSTNALYMPVFWWKHF